MIRFVATGFVALLSAGLAFAWPSSARLIGPDEADQVRGGATPHYSVTVNLCPTSTGGSQCPTIQCIGTPPQCPGSTWQTQNNLSYSTCTPNSNGFYGFCTNNQITCVTQTTCSGCAPGAGGVQFCVNTNPFQMNYPEADPSGTCTNS